MDHQKSGSPKWITKEAFTQQVEKQKDEEEIEELTLGSKIRGGPFIDFWKKFTAPPPPAPYFGPPPFINF